MLRSRGALRAVALGSVCVAGVHACTQPEGTARSCVAVFGSALVEIADTGVWFHRTEVTQSEFARFVASTGYTTVAEDADPDAPGLALGSAVFQVPTPRRPTWWRLDRTANWARPRGRDTEDEGMPDEPVVQIAYRDARAYAQWTGGRLPGLAEWRHAALAAGEWTASHPPPDMANTWQGVFPLINAEEDGYRRLAPVGSFPANAYGLHDMIGNAWEWTSTPARPGRGWLAGGSYLCNVDICNNGSPFGRQVQDLDFSADHIGFRPVYDQKPEGCV